MFSQVLNTAGLALDILGVLLLFKFGLPSKVQPEAWELGHDTEAQSVKLKRYTMGAYCGLALLVIGFALQIVGTWARA